MAEQKSNRISIYRVKNPDLADEDLIKDFDSYEEVSSIADSEFQDSKADINNLSAYYVRIPEVGTIYVRQARERKTRWSSSFFLDEVQVYAKSMGAALVSRVEVDGKPETYVVSFGHIGRFIVEPEEYDDRFGIKSALSVIDSDRLKQIVKNEFTGSNRITQQQISNGSNMAGFEIDPFGDYLKSVTGDVVDPRISKASIKGSAALSLSLEVDLSNILDLLEEITHIYRSGAYKTHYGWIDNIYLVSDSSLIEKLYADAIECINEKNGSVWFAVPDLVDYDKVGFFRYFGDNHNDVELNGVLEGKGGVLSIEDLEASVSARSVEDGKELKKWPLKKCICGEVEHEGELYGAADGKWFRIETDYAKRINSEYEKVEVYDKALEPFDKEKDTKVISKEGKEVTTYSEGAYLKRIAQEQSDKYVLLDQDLVKGVEVCDLLTPDALIHVKRYKGSNVMSHAFFQGLNSASLLHNDREFLDISNEKIKASNSDESFLINDRKKKDVVFAIIGKDSGPRPHLPLFSKISLQHTLERLRGLGYRGRVIAVPICETDESI